MQADALLAGLQELTAKRLTAKNPTMPTTDALAHWERLREMLGEIADLYLAAEAAANGSRSTVPG